MDYAGKTVLVTGASSGIGAESAKMFAARGASVVLVARRKDRLQQVQGQIEGAGGRADAIGCDVADISQVAGMAGWVAKHRGTPDILVNNAGFAVYGPVSGQTESQIASQMTTNYLGMAYCIKQFLPGMVQRGSGHIVNVASVAASVGLPGIAPYCASKFAMLGFSEGLRGELAGTGVGVTVVSPIMVRTEFFDHKSFGAARPGSRLSLSAKTVAKAVLRASSSRRLEIMVPSAVRVAVWAKQTVPYAIDPLISRAFAGQMDRAT